MKKIRKKNSKNLKGVVLCSKSTKCPFLAASFKLMLVIGFNFISDFAFSQVYSAPTSFSPGTLYINKVTFTAANTVTNTSTFTGGYQNFTSITKPTQEQGENITVAVTGNITGRIKAWIDWNKDGDFDDSGEQIYDTATGIVTTAPPISFTIPLNTAPGDYRIRVKNHYNDLYLVVAWIGPYFDNFGPSDNFTQTLLVFRKFGETEDYVFTVTPTCKKAYTGANGAWNNALNWTPPGIPTAADCITIDGKAVNIPGAYTGYGKSITLKNTATLNVASTGNITIADEVNVSANSTLELQDAAGLTQITDVDNATANNNAGKILMHRNTQPMYRYDFTYWSSPVEGVTCHALSPNTLGDKYFYWDPGTQAWITDYNGDDVMIPAKGYIIRAPQTYSIDPSVTEVYNSAVFNGKPHNGTVNIATEGSVDGAEKWNLIGNPYPSAIDVEKFLLANSSKLDGTIYLWTHNTPISYNVYTTSDYATYNFTGGLGTGYGDSAPTESGASINAPTKYIGAGQSFFVKGISNGTAIAAFKNTMRESGNNTQFFRTVREKPMNQEELAPGKSRVWINMTNDEGAFSQTLVGYVDNATDGLDWGYDGDLFGGNYIAVYSIAEGKSLAIQGRSLPFDNGDLVSLGYTTSLSGTFKISIDHFDGFSGQDIYLEDQLLNVIHNLKDSGYSFTTEAGTFNGRFVLRYTANSILNVEKNTKINGQVTVYKDPGNAIIINGGAMIINEVMVYDVSGRLLYAERNINRPDASIRGLFPASRVLIVNVHTNDAANVSRKIIF